MIHRSIEEGLVRVCDQQAGVYLLQDSKTRTMTACSRMMIEREESRCELLTQHHVALRTGKMPRESQNLLSFCIGDHDAIPPAPVTLLHTF